MRLVHLVLAGSLIANLVFAITWARRAPAPDSDQVAAPPEDSSGPGASRGVTSDAQAMAGLERGDPTALRDRLRALGWEEDKVTAVVRALLWTRYYERRRELVAKHRAGGPVWRDDRTVRLTPEELAELRELSSRIRDQAFKLLGPGGLDATGMRAVQHGYLPAAKAALLQEIDKDYAEMRSQLTAETQVFRVPSDAEKFNYLEQQRRKDIEAALTPEELADYDRHNSPSGLVLRERLARLGVSDSEFNAIYEAQRKPDKFPLPFAPGALLPNQPVALTPEQSRQSMARRAAQEEANAEIRAILGEERWAQFQSDTQPDYRHLQAAARRFNFEPATIQQVYALRAETSAASERIGADPSLTPEKKVEALVALAERTRGQVRAALGEEIGNAYLNVGMQWLNQMQSGMTVTFTENGMRMRPVVPGARPTMRPPAQK